MSSSVRCKGSAVDSEGLAAFTPAQAEETVRLATKAGVFGVRDV